MFTDDELEGFEKSLVFLDDLTGLYNRRFLNHLFEARWLDLTGSEKRLSLVIIDLDDFKTINDRYGHLAGDDFLRSTGDVLKSYFRRDDFVIRYGGDEFVVVLPGANATEAQELARRARDAMGSNPVISEHVDDTVDCTVTFSIGAATYPQDGNRGESVLAVADRRLYEDKQRRRPSASPRWPHGLAASLAFVAAVLLGIVYWNLKSEVAPQPAEPRPAAQAATESIEAELRERILELQAQTTLPEELPPTRDVQADYEARIRELEATVDGLRSELEATRSPAIPSGATPKNGEPPGLAEKPSSTSPVALDVELSGSDPDPSRVDEQTATLLAPDAIASEAALGLPSSSSIGPPMAPGSEPSTESDESAGFPEPIIRRPVASSSVRADYPPIALRMRQEASVLVLVVVDAGGQAQRAEVVGKRAGFGFDEAAITAALKADYQPGAQDGQPLEMETLIWVRFQLRD